jgi:hypothetical protein
MDRLEFDDASNRIGSNSQSPEVYFPENLAGRFSMKAETPSA